MKRLWCRVFGHVRMFAGFDELGLAYGYCRRCKKILKAVGGYQ
jgi:hypothetical protein